MLQRSMQRSSKKGAERIAEPWQGMRKTSQAAATHGSTSQSPPCAQVGYFYLASILYNAAKQGAANNSGMILGATVHAII